MSFGNMRRAAGQDSDDLAFGCSLIFYGLPALAVVAVLVALIFGRGA